MSTKNLFNKILNEINKKVNIEIISYEHPNIRYINRRSDGYWNDVCNCMNYSIHGSIVVTTVRPFLIYPIGYRFAGHYIMDGNPLSSNVLLIDIEENKQFEITEKVFTEHFRVEYAR